MAVICLGLKIQDSRKARKLLIFQSRKASSILTRFRMDGCNAVDTPIEDCKDLETNATSCANNSRGANWLPYREPVGSFLYLIIGIRP